MRILSFSWTTEQFKQGIKTVTRRMNKPKFNCGDIVQAYDKLPHHGGKKIGLIKILDVRKVRLREISDGEVAKEGFPSWTKSQFIYFIRSKYKGIRRSKIMWRIEFEKLGE